MDIVRTLSVSLAALLLLSVVAVAHAADEFQKAITAHRCQPTDYEGTARGLQQAAVLAERASQAPSEDDLLSLTECYERLKDITGQTWALEKLVTYYPRPPYWSELIARTQRRKDFGERLALDVLLLKKATDALNGADDYLAIVTLATKAGYPAEAADALDQGFERGILGVGVQAAHHRELRARIAREANESRKTVHSPEVQREAAESVNGEKLVALGYAHVTQGEFSQGISLMKLGLRKGGIDRPQDATMRLGIAYLLAGQKSQALLTLATVTGAHGAADLGRLWYLYALQRSM